MPEPCCLRCAICGFSPSLSVNNLHGFQALAWKRGARSAWGRDGMTFASGWSGLAWGFVALALNGTLQEEDYQEQAQNAIGPRQPPVAAGEVEETYALT